MYTHILVSSITVPTSPHEPEDKILDGLRVTDKLWEFATQLRQTPAFRGCKFGLVHSGNKINAKVYVYFPNQIYVLGSIGYGDCSVGNHVRMAYYVRAPGIANKKYHYSSKAHHWVLSQSVTKAVVNAKKHLRPYSPAAIAGVTEDAFTTAFNAKRWDYTNAEDRAFVALKEAANSFSGAITQELLHLYNSGYTFTNPNSVPLIKAVAEATAETAEVRGAAHRVSMVFVHQSPIAGVEPSIVVVDGPGEGVTLMNGSRAIRRAFQDKERVGRNTRTYPMSDLPDVVAERVSVLNMVNDDTFVEGVGYKYNESIFYVMA